MVQKRHVSLILVGAVLLLVALSWVEIPEAFAAVQRSFVLNPDSASFSFEERLFSDGAVSKEYNYNGSSLNATYFVNIPRNSTILNATMNLTGKIIYVYSVQAAGVNGIRGLSIGDDSKMALGAQETQGRVKLLYGINGS